MSYRYLINNVALYATEPANQVIETFVSQIGGSWTGVCHDEVDLEQTKGVRVFSYYTGDQADFDLLKADELLDVRYQYYEDGTDNQNEMIATVFPVLDADSATIVRLTSVELDLLYAHPLWQLWCCKFEDKDSLEIAYDKVFGTTGGLDKRKSLDALKDVVRTNIKGLLT